MTVDDGKLLLDSFYELDENIKLNKIYKLKSKKMIMEDLSVQMIILYFFLPNSIYSFFIKIKIDKATYECREAELLEQILHAANNCIDNKKFNQEQLNNYIHSG